MNTNEITIGRDPYLTMFIVNAIAERQRKKDRWNNFKARLKFWKR